MSSLQETALQIQSPYLPSLACQASQSHLENQSLKALTLKSLSLFLTQIDLAKALPLQLKETALATDKVILLHNRLLILPIKLLAIKMERLVLLPARARVYIKNQFSWAADDSACVTKTDESGWSYCDCRAVPLNCPPECPLANKGYGYV